MEKFELRVFVLVTVLPRLKPHGILSDTGCELYCPTHLSLVLSQWDIK